MDLTIEQIDIIKHIIENKRCVIILKCSQCVWYRDTCMDSDHVYKRAFKFIQSLPEEDVFEICL